MAKPRRYDEPRKGKAMYSPTLGRWMQMDPIGYPDGLKGDDIPMGGYILSTIEACEEMRMNGYSEEQIQGALQTESGKKFHPKVAAAYHEVLQLETKVA